VGKDVTEWRDEIGVLTPEMVEANSKPYCAPDNNGGEPPPFARKLEEDFVDSKVSGRKPNKADEREKKAGVSAARG